MPRLIWPSPHSSDVTAQFQETESVEPSGRNWHPIVLRANQVSSPRLETEVCDGCVIQAMLAGLAAALRGRRLRGAGIRSHDSFRKQARAGWANWAENANEKTCQTVHELRKATMHFIFQISPLRHSTKIKEINLHLNSFHYKAMERQR